MENIMVNDKGFLQTGSSNGTAVHNRQSVCVGMRPVPHTETKRLVTPRPTETEGCLLTARQNLGQSLHHEAEAEVTVKQSVLRAQSATKDDKTAVKKLQFVCTAF